MKDFLRWYLLGRFWKRGHPRRKQVCWVVCRCADLREAYGDES